MEHSSDQLGNPESMESDCDVGKDCAQQFEDTEDDYREATFTSTVPIKTGETENDPRFRQHETDDDRPTTAGTDHSDLSRAAQAQEDAEMANINKEVMLRTQRHREKTEGAAFTEPLFTRNAPVQQAEEEVVVSKELCGGQTEELAVTEPPSTPNAPIKGATEGFAGLQYRRFTPPKLDYILSKRQKTSSARSAHPVKKHLKQASAIDQAEDVSDYVSAAHHPNNIEIRSETPAIQAVSNDGNESDNGKALHNEHSHRSYGLRQPTDNLSGNFDQEQMNDIVFDSTTASQDGANGTSSDVHMIDSPADHGNEVCIDLEQQPEQATAEDLAPETVCHPEKCASAERAFAFQPTPSTCEQDHDRTNPVEGGMDVQSAEFTRCSEPVGENSTVYNWQNFMNFMVKEAERELHAKHFQDHLIWRSQLEEAIKGKEKAELDLGESERRLETKTRELKDKCKAKAEKCRKFLNGLGRDMTQLKAHAKAADDGMKELSTAEAAARVEAATRMCTELGSRYTTLKGQLATLRQGFEASLEDLKKENKSLTSEIHVKNVLLSEERGRCATLEQQMEQWLSVGGINDEARSFFADNRQSLADATKRFEQIDNNVKQFREDQTLAVGNLRRELEQAVQATKGVPQELVDVRVSVERLDASISKDAGQATNHAIEGLKAGCTRILGSIDASLKFFTTQQEGLATDKEQVSKLRDEIEARGAVIIAEQAKSASLQNEIGQLKEKIQSLEATVAPRSLPDSSRPVNEPHGTLLDKEALLEARQTELTIIGKELTEANATIKELQDSVRPLQDRIKVLEDASANFDHEKQELRGEIVQAVANKEREMSAVSKKTQAGLKAEHDNKIKQQKERAIKDLEGTKSSAQALEDRVRNLSQNLENLRKSHADAASLQAANDSLAAELTTQKSQLAESNTQKTSALQKLSEAHRHLSEVQASEKQCKNDMQQLRESESAMTSGIDRMKAQHKANIDHVSESIYQGVQAKHSRLSEQVKQLTAKTTKLQTAKDDAIREVEVRLEKAESLRDTEQNRFERELKNLKDSLQKAETGRDQAMISVERMREEQTEAVGEAGRQDRSQEVQLPELSMSLTQSKADSGVMTSQEVVSQRSLHSEATSNASQPRRQRKKVDRQQASRGPIVEGTESTEGARLADGRIGMFTQIARQPSDGTEMLLDNLPGSSQIMFDSLPPHNHTEYQHQPGPVVEETQQALRETHVSPTLRGKLSELDRNSKARGSLPPHRQTELDLYEDSQVPDRLSRDGLALNKQGQRDERMRNKPTVQPNSASKRRSQASIGTPAVHSHRVLAAEHTFGEDDDTQEHRQPSVDQQDQSSSPAFAASQTNVVQRTTTYHSQGSARNASQVSRTPSAPGTIDPRLLQKSTQSTVPVKRKSSTPARVSADAEGPGRKIQRTSKTPVAATSPPSQHTRQRQSIKDLPPVPATLKRTGSNFQTPRKAASQSRVLNLSGQSGTMSGKRRSKNQSKSDEMNARFSQERR